MIRFQRINIAILALMATLGSIAAIVSPNVDSGLILILGIIAIGFWYVFSFYTKDQLQKSRGKLIGSLLVMLMFGGTLFSINNFIVSNAPLLLAYLVLILFINPGIVFFRVVLLIAKEPTAPSRPTYIKRTNTPLEDTKTYDDYPEIYKEHLNECEKLESIQMDTFTTGEKGNMNNLISLLKSAITKRNVDDASRYLKQIKSLQQRIEKRISAQENKH